MKLKKGDNVKIVRGKDKGKTGVVDKVFVLSKKVLIQGINMVKRHKKARSRDEKSEIINIPQPLALSNVMLICPTCKNPARVGFIMEGNKKIRVCKKCEKKI